jgi:cytochrome c-type biogenesis protein CcmH/NrfG
VRARSVAFLLVAVLGVYLLLVGWRGVVLVDDGLSNGDWVSVVLGLSVLVFPVVAAALVWREVRFGLDTQHLAAHLAARDELPPDDLPRRPSGRVDKTAARAAFDAGHAAAQQHPHDPAAWYRLGLAYNDLGDRRQARAAMREAIRLWRSGDAEGA